MLEPLELICRIRKTFGRYPDMSGGCLKFHQLLCGIYERCNGWYDGEHIISEIDGEFYDVDGIAVRTSRFIPLTETDLTSFRYVM